MEGLHGRRSCRHRRRREWRWGCEAQTSSASSTSSCAWATRLAPYMARRCEASTMGWPCSVMAEQPITTSSAVRSSSAACSSVHHQHRGRGESRPVAGGIWHERLRLLDAGSGRMVRQALGVTCPSLCGRGQPRNSGRSDGTSCRPSSDGQPRCSWTTSRTRPPSRSVASGGRSSSTWTS